MDKDLYEAGMNVEEHQTLSYVYIDLKSISAIRPDINKKDDIVGTFIEGCGIDFVTTLLPKEVYLLLGINHSDHLTLS